jgi:hypothetical protein
MYLGLRLEFPNIVADFNILSKQATDYSTPDVNQV